MEVSRKPGRRQVSGKVKGPLPLPLIFQLGRPEVSSVCNWADRQGRSSVDGEEVASFDLKIRIYNHFTL